MLMLFVPQAIRVVNSLRQGQEKGGYLYAFVPIDRE